MLIFLLSLIGIGALLAVAIVMFGLSLAFVLTGLLTLLSFAANLIGLSIVSIFFFLYLLLPFDTYVITAICLISAFAFVCWYHSDKFQEKT